MARGSRVINLCFHGIGQPARPLERGEDAYWITEPRFLEIVDEVAGWPAVGISFDDGNASDVELGLRALADRRLDGSFFVLAGRVDQPGSVTTTQLRELVASGMLVGSHGMDHRPWTDLDEAGRQRELVEARDRLEQLVGSRVDHAACPLGRYDRNVLRSLRRLGYGRVYTSDRTAAATGAWLQPRYSVRRDDTADSIRSTVLERQSARHSIRPRMSSFVKRLR